MPVSKIEGKQRLIYNNACFEHRANYKMSEENKIRTAVSARGGGGGDSHMEQTGMLVGNFEFSP